MAKMTTKPKNPRDATATIAAHAVAKTFNRHQNRIKQLETELTQLEAVVRELDVRLTRVEATVPPEVSV